MITFIGWHKNYIEWRGKKLNVSNYAIIWITFIKGVFIGLLIYHFFISTESHAQTLRIIDGDTIVINGEKIRFSGIDSPELKQTCIQDEQNVYCGIFAKKLTDSSTEMLSISAMFLFLYLISRVSLL